VAGFFRGLFPRIVLASLIFLGGGEIASRCYWWLAKDVPFWSSGCLWYAFYPKLRMTGLDSTAVRDSDGTYDVLILGGSTVSDEISSVRIHLSDGLQKRLSRPVRIFNLAIPGHNSRDSLLKYRRLANRHFDLVLAYDGINDTRMNNTPPGKFCSDYSHSCWYANLNFLETHPWLSRAALPFTLQVLGDRIAEELGLAWRTSAVGLVCRTNWIPNDKEMEYGADIRTKGSFASHYREMVVRGQEKGDRLVLMTFAYYIPANYTLETFRAHELDYANSPPGFPVEEWGKPAYVAEAIDRHNDAIGELAAQNPDVVFVDQQRLMPHSRQTFYDCCHFTETGCSQFVENILAAMDARK